jgi:hypothetical protein
VAGVREERAPVSGGAVLRLEVEAREVAAARRRSGEGKIVGGGEKFGRRRRLHFKGKRLGGGRRGGRRVETERGRERERGGPGASWSSATAWRDRWNGTLWGPGRQ